jgi:hypothetical protein
MGHAMTSEARASGMSTAPPARRRSVGSLVVIVIFAIIGCAAAGAGARTLWLAAATKSWPTVTGVVTASRIDKTTKGNQPAPYFSGVVEYSYEVDGTTYRSNRFSYSGLSESSEQSDIRAVIARYVPNRPVTVHYDPANPSQSVLQTGGGLIGWAMIAAGTLFLLFAAVITLSRLTA